MVGYMFGSSSIYPASSYTPTESRHTLSNPDLPTEKDHLKKALTPLHTADLLGHSPGQGSQQCPHPNHPHHIGYNII
jgi:hypothetical protein